MRPEGHEPTIEDRDLRDEMWPIDMHIQLERERLHGIDCSYTHYSRDEQIGRRQGFIRRFSRGALDPFEARSPFGYADESGHAVIRMGRI